MRADGSATVWTHSAQSQGMRAQIANTLGLPIDKVVVRWRPHATQSGRTTHCGDGAEADAAILSQMTGKPVRVQWTLGEDLEWSSVSPGWMSKTRAALDATGRLTAIHTAFSPHMFDSRNLGAILAGLPTSTFKPGNWIATEKWPYDKVAARLEGASAIPNIAMDTPTGDLRGNIMRRRGQRQQNFALEALINEAAAAAGADPLRFRLDHTTDERLIGIIEATAKAANWQPRPSPSPRAKTRKIGSEPLSGRGGHHHPRQRLLGRHCGDRGDTRDRRDSGDEVHDRLRLRQGDQSPPARSRDEERRGDGPQ